jgi:Fe-S-cluster containining protein
MTDPEVCARCQGACCRIDPADAPFVFPLFEDQIQRIAAYTGDRSFVTRQGNTPEFVRRMKLLFEPEDEAAIDRLFPAGGTHFRLATADDNACTLLTDKGCRLPADIRPYHCRVFPAWVRRGLVHLVVDDQCPAVAGRTDMGSVLRSVGLTGRRAAELRDAIRRDWGLLPVGF